MTTIEIELPDELVRRAMRAGLLSNGAIRELLEEAMRRQAGRRLIEVARRLHDADIEPMSLAEIDAEVRAVRAERRSRETGAERP